jgi:hypothetical protein
MLGMMREGLTALLLKLEGPLSPIRSVAERLLREGAEVEEEDGAFLISRPPKIAPQAFALVLYEGLPDEIIDRYIQQFAAQQSIRSFRLPDAYRQILRILNGASVFELSLFGVPPSMCASPPLLNRGARQPLDIATAGTSWIRAYKPDREQFHFGSSPHSRDENLGYFLNPDGSVEARRRGGLITTSWRTMRDFLSEEIARNEAAFAEYEERSEAFRTELQQAEAATRASRKKT